MGKTEKPPVDVRYICKYNAEIITKLKDADWNERLPSGCLTDHENNVAYITNFKSFEGNLDYSFDDYSEFFQLKTAAYKEWKEVEFIPYNTKYGVNPEKIIEVLRILHGGYKAKIMGEVVLGFTPATWKSAKPIILFIHYKDDYAVFIVAPLMGSDGANLELEDVTIDETISFVEPVRVPFYYDLETQTIGYSYNDKIISVNEFKEEWNRKHEEYEKQEGGEEETIEEKLSQETITYLESITKRLEVPTRPRTGRERWVLVHELANLGYRFLGDKNEPDEFLVEQHKIKEPFQITLTFGLWCDRGVCKEEEDFTFWIGKPTTQEGIKLTQEIAMDNLTPIEFECLPEDLVKKYVIDEKTPEEEPPWRRFMDVIKGLEKEHGLEVPVDIAITAATEVGVENPKDLIGELKRDGVLYSPANGLIARVEIEKPKTEEEIKEFFRIKEFKVKHYVGYRTETAYGIGGRDLRSIVKYEIDELENKDIIDWTGVSDYIALIDALYAHGYTEAVWLCKDKQHVIDHYCNGDPTCPIKKYEITDGLILSDLGEDGQLIAYHPEKVKIAERTEGEEAILKESTENGFPLIPTNLIPYEEALRAYEGISQTPERSAEVIINDFYNSIRSIYDDLSKYAKTETQKITLDYHIKEFAEEYATRYRAILHQKAGLISPMVAGPSKFPTARMRTLSERVDKRERELLDWIKKQEKRIKKALEEVGIEEEGGEVAHLQNEIAKLNEKLKRMKAINKIVKSKSLSDTEKKGKLAEMGYSQPVIEKLLTPDYMGQLGFPDYTLTSIRNKIKTREERIETLTKKEEKKKRGEEIIYERCGLKIVENPDVDRYQLLFEEKPEKALRDELKKNGFKWSPTNKAWQRMVTPETLYVIKNQIIPQWEEKYCEETTKEEKPPEKEILFYKYVKKELDEGAVAYTSYPSPVSEIIIAQLPNGRWNVEPSSPVFPEESFKTRTEALEYAETNMKIVIEEETGEKLEKIPEVAPPYELIKKERLSQEELEQLKRDIADLKRTRKAWEKQPPGYEARQAIPELDRDIADYEAKVRKEEKEEAKTEIEEKIKPLEVPIELKPEEVLRLIKKFPHVTVDEWEKLEEKICANIDKAERVLKEEYHELLRDTCKHIKKIREDIKRAEDVYKAPVKPTTHEEKKKALERGVEEFKQKIDWYGSLYLIGSVLREEDTIYSDVDVLLSHHPTTEQEEEIEEITKIILQDTGVLISFAPVAFLPTDVPTYPVKLIAEIKKPPEAPIMEPPKIPEKVKIEEKVKIRVLEDIPTFMGTDGEIYELKEGDIVELPKSNADVLCERGVVELFVEIIPPEKPVPEKVKIHGILKTRYRCPVCYRAAPDNFCMVHSDVEAIDLLATDEQVKEAVIDLTFWDLFKTKQPEKKRWTIEELYEAIGIDVEYAPEFLAKPRLPETYAQYYARELGVEIEEIKPMKEEEEKEEEEELKKIREALAKQKQKAFGAVPVEDVLYFPSVIIIAGKRRSGKTALGFYILEIAPVTNRFVLGMPEHVWGYLPEGIKPLPLMAETLEELPMDSIFLIDEASLSFYAKAHRTNLSAIIDAITLKSAQRGQTFIFVSHNLRKLQPNIILESDILLFKEPSLTQVEMERREIIPRIKKVKAGFDAIPAPERVRFSYMFSDDYAGLTINPLPSFWRIELSEVWRSYEEQTEIEEKTAEIKEAALAEVATLIVLPYSPENFEQVKNYLCEHNGDSFVRELETASQSPYNRLVSRNIISKEEADESAKKIVFEAMQRALMYPEVPPLEIYMWTKRIANKGASGMELAIRTELEKRAIVVERVPEKVVYREMPSAEITVDSNVLIKEAKEIGVVTELTDTLALVKTDDVLLWYSLGQLVAIEFV